MAAPALPGYRRNVDCDGPPLLFIHGIKGSRLVGADGKTRWLTAAMALGLSTPDLRLPLTWNDDRQAEDDLVATEPIACIDIIPRLLESQIYGPWLKQAEGLGRPFYSFAYDWRRDNLESLARFKDAVAAVRERHGGSQVQLVAHSMGGLISLPLLTEHPEWFCHALFAGVPFRGGVGFFEDMHVGLPTGRNRKVTSPEMLFTCPSTYVLYPLGRSDCVDSSGTVLDVDFFNADHWVEHGMGIFADAKKVTEENTRFLRKSLERAKALKGLLEYREQDYPPITVLACKAHPTLGVAMKNGPQSVRGWDLTTQPRKPGDSRVCYDYMMPPEGFEYEVVETEFTHSAMLNDPAVPGILHAGQAAAISVD